MAHRFGNVGDVAGGVVSARRKDGAPRSGLVVRAALGGLAAAEKLDNLGIADVEGEESDGEGRDLVADGGDADVVDDQLNLLLGPLEEALVSIDDG